MRSVFASIVVLMAIAACSAKNVQPLVTFVDNIDNFAKNNPDSGVYPMEMVDSLQQPKCSKAVRFFIGSRQNGVDSLLNSFGSNNNYNPSRDVSFQVGYPNNGLGAIITSVEIDVNALSDGTNAFVVAGGVGQRFVQIVIEAKNANQLSYTARFFGKN